VSKAEALAKVLKQDLMDIQVYKFGKVNLKVYILGNANHGSWSGLATEVVET